MTLLSAGCIVIGLLLAPQATTREAPDLSTPTAAVHAFYTALAKGDAESAKAAAVANETETKWIEAQADLNGAFKRLGRVSVKRFGDDGRVLKPGLPAEAALKKAMEVIDEEGIEENGNTALVRVNPRFPLRIVRQQKLWKVDLVESSSAAERAGGPPLSKQTGIFREIATYLNDIASGIEEGRYATVDDARADLRRRREALESKSER